MNGWIKIDRRIVNMDGYFGEKFNRTMCWIDLLLLAEWKDERSFFIRGNRVTAKRGQVVMSAEDLAKRWNLNRRTVIKRLQEFEEDERITISHSKLVNTITIVNFESYQGCSKAGKTEMYDAQQNLNAIVRYTDRYEEDIQQSAQQSAQQNVTQSTQQNAQQNLTSIDCDSDCYNEYTKNDAQQSAQQNAQQSAQPIKNNKNNIKENLLTKVKEISSPPGGAEVLGRSEIHFSKIKDLWNNTCLSYSKLITLSEARKNKIRNRIEEMGGEEKAIPILQQVFSNLQESKFLKGDNARGWKANFDWVFNNDKNWVKVYEGNYENRKSDGFNSVPNQTYDGQTAVDKFTTDFAEWINGIPIG